MSLDVEHESSRSPSDNRTAGIACAVKLIVESLWLSRQIAHHVAWIGSFKGVFGLGDHPALTPSNEDGRLNALQNAWQLAVSGRESRPPIVVLGWGKHDDRFRNLPRYPIHLLHGS